MCECVHMVEGEDFPAWMMLTEQTVRTSPRKNEGWERANWRGEGKR